MHLSVISIGEIRKGIDLLDEDEPRRGAGLRNGRANRDRASSEVRHRSSAGVTRCRFASASSSPQQRSIMA